MAVGEVGCGRTVLGLGEGHGHLWRRGATGAQVVFLECEDGNRKLKAFYEKNAFVACGKRTDDEDGITYLQMFRFLKRTSETAP